MLAWLLLTDARRPARVDAGGDLVPLEEQDRSAWDRAAIVEGLTLLRSSLRTGARGRYAMLACIAAVHAEAPTPGDTDWQQIVQLYDVLLQRWPSPVVALNRAIAVGAWQGPAAGLTALDSLADEPDPAGYTVFGHARPQRDRPAPQALSFGADHLNRLDGSAWAPTSTMIAGTCRDPGRRQGRSVEHTQLAHEAELVDDVSAQRPDRR